MMTPINLMRYYKSSLRSAFVSMDSHMGAVKAYAGGTNYQHLKYDVVMGSRCQAGSTIKPLPYVLAMQNGVTPHILALNV